MKVTTSRVAGVVVLALVFVMVVVGAASTGERPDCGAPAERVRTAYAPAAC